MFVITQEDRWVRMGSPEAGPEKKIYEYVIFWSSAFWVTCKVMRKAGKRKELYLCKNVDPGEV